MNEDAEVKAIIDRLIELQAEAMTTDQEFMRIVSTPSAMRVLGLRGRVECEHHDGRKTYSVRARHLALKVQSFLDGLGNESIEA
ncbi:MAG: hypothetical protein KatS3mg082_1755 [Nitrospiraceae bacterium]|nr:MAG: hypothetical protein KatS3mg082_1755 [Nitrospiraceae bacterium]